MNPAVVCVGVGGWYPSGVARLLQSLSETNPEMMAYAWVNQYPPDSPEMPYCSKPFAMLEAFRRGHDVVIWLDAAFYAIKPLDPLLDQIKRDGYFLTRNGPPMGEWCKDAALEPLGITREQSFSIPEVSTYCVGLDLSLWTNRAFAFLTRWARLAADGITFPGAHTNNGANPGATGRTVAFCSADPRVKGHRHDQTAASAIAWSVGMDKLTERPRITDYRQPTQHPETLLVNQGMG